MKDEMWRHVQTEIHVTCETWEIFLIMYTLIILYKHSNTMYALLSLNLGCFATSTFSRFLFFFEQRSFFFVLTDLTYYTILLKVHCICHCKHTHKSTRRLFSYFIVYTSFSIILRRTTNSKKESISLYCKP